MFIIILLYVFLRQSEAVIYRLDDVDYARMPPLMYMDPYETCQLDTDALYCTAEITLVSDKPSSLLEMIKEYSEHRVTHFNHTLLRHGVCVTQTCENYYKTVDEDLKLTLEKCLNESFSAKYDLKVKISDEYYCKPLGRSQVDIDLVDIIVGIICFVLLFLNVVGSLCEFYCTHDNTLIKNMLCFSLKRNWNKLLSPATIGLEPRMKRLKSLHGLRAITTALVISAHSLVPVVTMIKNPKFVEQLYSVKPWYVFLNGSVIMQIFLMMSAFLLVYTLLIHSETHQHSWNVLPKHIFSRWLRLTPSYALILALTATWFRHLASGPLWDKYVGTEMRDCRQYWWQHILYINNYMHKTQCMMQTWYMAVDMQLFIFAIIIYLACKNVRLITIVLSSLLIIGSLIIIAHVYFQDLDGILMAMPEMVLTSIFTDPFFNNVYIRTHTNITGCVFGVATAYLVYHLQKQRLNKKMKTLTCRIIYWSFLPLGVMICYSGEIFYAEGPRASVYIRMFYAVFSKLSFSLMIGILIAGSILRIEDTQRSFLEWRGWTIPSRLSYCTYLLHLMFIRTYLASVTETAQSSYLFMFQVCTINLITSFVAACFLWLLVEAPLNNVVKKCLSFEPQEDKKKIHSIRATKEKES